MNQKEESGSKISHEATISSEAFVRAWRTGTPIEQGRMLFDLLGESVIARIRNIEETQRNLVLRQDKLEDNTLLLKDSVQKDFSSLETKWAYIFGGLAVVALILGPLITFFLQGFRSTGVCP